jgi:hypothetical protein
MKVSRLSALRTNCLCSRKYSWYLFLLEVGRPKRHSAAGMIMSKKNSRHHREPAILRLVAQRLNQTRHRVPTLFEVLYQTLLGWAEENQEILRILGIRAETQTRYRPGTNPKAPYSIKYIGTCPVYHQAVSLARIQTTGHSFRYVVFLIFITMATYLQPNDISATKTQKPRLSKVTPVAHRFMRYRLSLNKTETNSPCVLHNQLRGPCQQIT